MGVLPADHFHEVVASAQHMSAPGIAKLRWRTVRFSTGRLKRSQEPSSARSRRHQFQRCRNQLHCAECDVFAATVNGAAASMNRTSPASLRCRSFPGCRPR
eukprot:1892593-Rhodomonas_salina.5